jgi:Molybdopterin-binding domain of aldehyde dehydrogenase
VFAVSLTLLEKVRAAAAARFGGSTEEIELVDDRAHISDGRSVSFAELAADGLQVDSAFANNNKLTYAYGSAAAHVAVDPGTGRVELLDYLVVEDVGRIVNPLTLHGQAIGGVVQGLGGAFMENLVSAEYRSVSGDLESSGAPVGERIPIPRRDAGVPAGASLPLHRAHASDWVHVAVLQQQVLKGGLAKDAAEATARVRGLLAGFAIRMGQKVAGGKKLATRSSIFVTRTAARATASRSMVARP